jgi:hypothetical protein
MLRPILKIARFGRPILNENCSFRIGRLNQAPDLISFRIGRPILIRTIFRIGRNIYVAINKEIQLTQRRLTGYEFPRSANRFETTILAHDGLLGLRLSLSLRLKDWA